MSCTILGPGLVGCYLGAAAGSEQVVLGGSGALRGRRVALPSGTVEWQPEVVEITDGPLLVCCRAPDTPQALPADHLLAQNGIGQTGPAIACFFAIDQQADGTITATGPQPRIVIGRHPSQWRTVVTAWRKAGIRVDEVADVEAARWEKAILNATVGPLCLATGLSMGAVWATPDLRQLVLAATAEGMAIAHARGIEVRHDLVDTAQRFFSRVGDHQPSILADTRELPWVLDALVNAADRTPCPALRRIMARCHSALPLAAG